MTFCVSRLKIITPAIRKIFNRLVVGYASASNRPLDPEASLPEWHDLELWWYAIWPGSMMFMIKPVTYFFTA
jgi:hypothetical protein